MCREIYVYDMYLRRCIFTCVYVCLYIRIYVYKCVYIDSTAGRAQLLAASVATCIMAPYSESTYTTVPYSIYIYVYDIR